MPVLHYKVLLPFLLFSRDGNKRYRCYEERSCNAWCTLIRIWISSQGFPRGASGKESSALWQPRGDGVQWGWTCIRWVLCPITGLTFADPQKMGNMAYGDLYCQERDYAKWLVPSALSTWLIIKIDDVAYLHYKPYPELSCLMQSSCLGNQNQLLHLPANLKLHITQGTIPELLSLVVRLSVHWWSCSTFNLGCLLLLLWPGGRSDPTCHISLLMYLEIPPSG